ncbi:hypothetical protein CC1G_09502 [Coprinopsis cinerea okayama7|uniref:Major facilitator superfamily (MFS) profile domain-containing protein n=1 Tax=Coprinopsis cinerea (strain Okayama-7 / 130 / ATCC MYA-4618 / FGSC 9003) TaxID=240176 RepID=A8P0S0_COPC7|nr:hypothetical protein CC1G_09502 [Coprinopsis cinerea okayama7\|eukprot:XP_001837951.2 hypothetical protein CC1G_09502 [Coprinopsis cinerea okayama7\
MPSLDSPTLSLESTVVPMAETPAQQSRTVSIAGDDRIEKKDGSLSGEGSVNVKETGGDLEQPAGEATFPEGGLRAWLVVIGVVISQMCSFGYTNAYGVYNDYYVRYYLAKNYTSGQISWIGSVQLGLVLSSGLVSGRAFDRGYFYHLMIGGSILLVFCLFMLSITQPEKLYQVFLLQGIGMGIAIGLMYIPALGIISQYFLKRRSLALGIGTAGSALGGMLHPIMLNKWFHGSLGFHNGVRASAGLIGGLLLISIILMKPRPQAFAARKQNSDPGLLKNFRTFLSDIPYTITVFGTICVLSGLYFPIYFIQLNSIKNGINPDLAFYTIAILNGSSIIGRIVPNIFIYRFGAFNVLVPCTAVSAILVFCTLAVNNAVGTIFYSVLFGFFSGAYVGTLPPAITSLAHSDSEIGSRLGICFTFTGIGGLIGTPIAGLLLTSDFHWWRPIVFAGVCVSTGFLSFTCTRFLKARERGTHRV